MMDDREAVIPHGFNGPRVCGVWSVECGVEWNGWSGIVLVLVLVRLPTFPMEESSGGGAS